ncbi:DUF488 family protein [Giesbergeria anulus]|uniref:DUF488 domain-containing protein n=1 Tax=Giesbergeria anulus TaxID=180197 RepID=A0A1H9E7G7_9BURK|nr:DUF488 domain-containing protein [Giesbergeria anulus]SEQ21670.1 Protein of unknown function, DUF488 [Giesbergeria anulus]
MTIFTIGYEGLDIDTFMSLLAAYEIEAIVDVRELPLSRKPGFSKRALANVLNISGREYIHMVTLGCPKLVRDQYRVDGDWKRYTIGFMEHLKLQKSAIANLSGLVHGMNCALLCYEADSNFCHRSMVANAVRDFCGAEIKHIKATATIKKVGTDFLSQMAFA